MTALPAPHHATHAIASSAPSAVLGDELNEHKLLGTIMMEGLKDPTNTAFKQIAHFKEAYFTGHLNRVVFRAMCLVYADNQNVEYDSVLDRLKNMKNKTKDNGPVALEFIGGEQFLGSLMRLKGSNIKLLSELVVKAYLRRRKVTAAHKEIEWAQDGNLSLDQFHEKSAEQANELMLEDRSLRGTRAQSMTEGFTELELYLSQDRSDPNAGGWAWHTGLQGITDKMGGGLKKGKVYIFGARPGRGKSIMLQSIATAVTNQGGRPFIISLEMKPVDFWQRMLTAESGIEWDRIDTGNLEEDERLRLPECLRRLKDHKMGHNFLIEFMKSPTLAQMRMMIAQEINERGVDVFLLDYATFRKITPTKSGLQENIQQGLISQWLVDIATEFKIPVVSAAQTTRESEKRGGDPVMSDLEYSVAMEQDADFIGVLKDDDVRAGDDYTVTNCHVVKSRFGEEGIVPLIVRKSLFKFEDMRV